MYELLSGLPIAVNMLLFALLAGGIWLTGARLTFLADALCERFQLAASTVGLLFLALATSLPEIATTLSAAVKQNADLVLNNLFGGIALQTAILAVADFWARGAISNYPRKATHALEATLLVALMAGLQIAITIGEPVSFLEVGMGSTVIALAYAGSIRLLRRYDTSTDWVPVDLPDQSPQTSIRNTFEYLQRFKPENLMAASAVICMAILLLGVAIVEVSEVLAFQTGLGSGFIGATFLAAATSLPELSTTVTAVRLGAYTLAISNVFGSNLIMIVLVFPADILHYTKPILGTAGPTTQLALAAGTLVTVIFLTGLIVRRKPKLGMIGFIRRTCDNWSLTTGCALGWGHGAKIVLGIGGIGGRAQTPSKSFQLSKSGRLNEWADCRGIGSMVLIGSSVQRILEKNLVVYVGVLYKKLGLAFFSAVQAKFSIALLFIISTVTFSSLIPAQAQTACSPGLTTAPAGMGFHIDTTTAACSMITAPNVGAFPDGLYVGPTSSGFRSC